MLNQLPAFLCLSLVFLCFAGFAQAPFIYRGQLSTSGQPANGIYDIRFGLASAPNPGQGVIMIVTNESVVVSNGQFSVALDFGVEAFNGSPRWLEIGVRTNGSQSNFVLLSPRQPLYAVPYALQANVANRAAVATNLADGGASLSSVPAARLTGLVPPASLSGITAQQMDPWTDATYRDVNTNAVKGLIQTTSGPGRVTPFEFGAKGDGITDDTAALQAWLDAAQARNLIAELPPARTFYRISDALVVRRSGGLTLIGTGGQGHITGGPPYTRSLIHQVAPGRHALVITNIVGTGTPTDNVFLQGFMVTAETYSPGSYGIGFVGGIPDSDVNVIMNVATKNFGVGLFDGSGCNMSVISCSFGYCGDGIRIDGPVVNSVLIQSTIMTGNRSNGLNVVNAGNVTFDTGDIVTWKTDMAHLITIESGLVCIRNMNGEQGSPVEGIKVWSPRANANVILDAGGVMPVANVSDRTYSLSVSNARTVTISGTQLNAVASDGFPIIEYGSPPTTVSLKPFPQKIVVGTKVATNWIGNHLRTFIPPLDGSSPTQIPTIGGRAHAGLLNVFNNPGDTELVFSAYMSKFNNVAAPVQVPLLQYSKDRLSTMTVKDLTVTGAFKPSAGTSGSFVNYPGVLTRINFENGVVTGAEYEQWAEEALDYVTRANLTNPADVSAADLLVKRLKAEGLWEKADAIYLFRGGNAASASVNLISNNYPITWNLPPANFGTTGVTGNGVGYGISELSLTNAPQFTASSGSLLVYVGNPGSASSMFAGAVTSASGAYLGGGVGTFAFLNGGVVTNLHAQASGPWIASRVNANDGFLLSRSSTNTVTAPTLGAPAANLGILCGLNETGAPQNISTANLRAVWLGAGLSTGDATALAKCFDDYMAILGLKAP